VATSTEDRRGAGYSARHVRGERRTRPARLHGGDRGGLAKWLRGWGEGWDSWRLEDIEFRAAGDDQVIALFRMIAKGGHSGMELERRDAITYRVQDGAIARMEYFSDQVLGLEAVGLRG
jgi:ketosteroid isomerase-like protein